MNIAFGPNVTMRTTYIDTYPHLVVVCTRDIDIGEEILLDYGEAYNDIFLKPKVPSTVTSKKDMNKALPKIGLDSDISSDDDENIESA